MCVAIYTERYDGLSWNPGKDAGVKLGDTTGTGSRIVGAAQWQKLLAECTRQWGRVDCEHVKLLESALFINADGQLDTLRCTNDYHGEECRDCVMLPWETAEGAAVTGFAEVVAILLCPGSVYLYVCQ